MPLDSFSKIRNIRVARAVVGGWAQERGGRDEQSSDDRCARRADAGPGRGGAPATLRVGNDQHNTFHGTFGDNKGQDTFFGLGAGDTLVGRSVDQLAGGSGPDRLKGNDGNNTLDGGAGEDKIFTGNGFDFVYARDGDEDVINCNGQKGYRIIFDAIDDIEGCPRANTNTKNGANVLRGAGVAVAK